MNIEYQSEIQIHHSLFGVHYLFDVRDSIEGVCRKNNFLS